MQVEPKPHHKKVYGLQYSPNLEAKKIEEYLGIAFVEKPRIVMMTGRNRLAVALNCVVLPFKNLELVKSVFESRRFAEGTYHPEYNLIMANTSSRRVGYHENMHALAHQLNRNYFQEGLDAFNEVVKARLSHRPHPQDAAEKMWLNKIFDEGVAEVGALHVLLDRGNNAPTGVVEPYQDLESAIVDHDHLYELLTVNQLITQQVAIDKMVSEVQRRVRVYEPVNWDSWEDSYFDLRCLGIYFGQGVLNELLRQGNTLADSFTKLILNPPTKLEELRDPINYAKAIIG